MAWSLSWPGVAPAQGKGVNFNWFLQLMANFSVLNYQTGSWTPVIGGTGGQTGQTYTTQSGTYVANGALVAAFFNVTLSAKGTITGNVLIQGLPFAPNGGLPGATHALIWNSLATTWVNVTGIIVGGTNGILVRGASAAAANNETSLTTTDLNNTSQFSGCAVYGQ